MWPAGLLIRRMAAKSAEDEKSRKYLEERGITELLQVIGSDQSIASRNDQGVPAGHSERIFFAALEI